MRESRIGTFLALLLAVQLALPGCVSPPDWAFFDTERHPTGAYPAQVGYYTGAYIVSPLTFLVSILLAPFTGEPPPLLIGPGEMDAFGLLFGLGLGAPFHLFALPFKDGDEADSVEDPWEPPPEESPSP